MKQTVEKRFILISEICLYKARCDKSKIYICLVIINKMSLSKNSVLYFCPLLSRPGSWSAHLSSRVLENTWEESKTFLPQIYKFSQA